jgi:myosin-7
VVAVVKERIGLLPRAMGFSLFEVFGQLERNMLPNEKVADAMFKWEKYARSTHSPKTLKLTFKKRLFVKPFMNPNDSIEFRLLLHQAIDDVVSDRFPLSLSEAVYLAGLRAQVVLGPYGERIDLVDYHSIIERYVPKYMRTRARPEDVARKHRDHGDLSEQECNENYLLFIRQWPLYGSTIFDVLQGYTGTLPKNLWLAVNEHGVHILKRREKEPLVSYEYKDIVNYSPSLKNLMIVTESLTKGTKFVFNTSQASQIAHLIRDYTRVIVERQRLSQSGYSRRPPR